MNENSKSRCVDDDELICKNGRGGRRKEKNACGRQPQNVILFTRRPGETLRGEGYVFIIFVSVASVVCQVATKREGTPKK